MRSKSLFGADGAAATQSCVKAECNTRLPATGERQTACEAHEAQGAQVSHMDG
eukprot:c28044_g1_i1 orf=77-235(+)